MKAFVQRAGKSARMSDERFYLVILAAAAAVAAAILFYFAMVLHRNFLTIACDTALLQNGLINTLHGHWFRNTVYHSPNLLGMHTSFLLLLFTPFYTVAPYPETFFALQIIGIYSTVLPLYFIARELTQRPFVAFLVASSALISPFLLHMALAPFHLETWIAAAAFWSYFFYLRNNSLGFLASIGIAVCCGEQAALIFIALGIALLLVEDGCAWRKRFGLLSLVAGFLWMILAVGVITPYANTNHSFNMFAYNYSQWNIQSAADLPRALVHHPLMALRQVFGPDRWLHILMVVGVPLLAAFVSWRSFLLLAPIPAYLLMSEQEFFLYFHAYYYTFAFFAGYVGLLIFLRRWAANDRVVLMALVATFFFNIGALCFASGFYFQLAGGIDESFSQTLREQFAAIPPEAGVYGPHRYSVYLSNRENMVIGDIKDDNLDFDSMMSQRFEETNVKPEQIDYIVSDFLTDQCGWRNGYMDPDQMRNRSSNIDRFVQSGEWEMVWQQNDVVILKRVRK